MNAVSGLILVDKPAGLTSHDVVVHVRRRARGTRVGHAGTLDPAATGLLIVLLGRATKLAETLMDEGKEYHAVVEFGRVTDTGDATGRVLSEHAGPAPEAAAVAHALEGFIGEIHQVPPMVSALKVGGRRLYDLARVGQSVVRRPRRVRIDAIEVLEYRPPHLSLRVACGRGMYLRALASDLGETLGVGGTLAALRRTRVGPFTVERAVALADLESPSRGGSWSEHVIPLEGALDHLPSVVVAGAHARRLLQGQPTGWNEVISFPKGLAAGSPLRVVDPDGRLLAMARALAPAPAAIPPSSVGAAAGPFRLERVLADPGDV